MPKATGWYVSLTVDRNDWRKISLLWNSCCEFVSQPKLLMSEWVGAVTCEQALLFGRAKRVSRLRANECWSREGPRTPFLGPSLERSRGARFAHLNRRACSQAIGGGGGVMQQLYINNENWTRKWMTIWPWRGRKVLSVAHVLSWITVSIEKKLNQLIMINVLKSYVIPVQFENDYSFE